MKRSAAFRPILRPVALAWLTLVLSACGYDTPPRVLEAYVPVYPVSRLLSGKTGSCKVSFTIGADGTATDARPDPDADEKMCAHGLYALRHWRFSPATKDGQPVTTRFRMPFDYDIRR